MKGKMTDPADPPPAVVNGDDDKQQNGGGSDEVDFASMGLDERLSRALGTLNYSKPTLVQSKAIPLGLDGKDVVARAKTGSGKTVAYLIPVLQQILQRKSSSTSSDARTTSSLILVPTRELADQTSKVIKKLTAYCSKLVSHVNIAQNIPDHVQRSLLSELPDIVISTPSRAASFISSGDLSPSSNLRHLVIDESDLVLSFGYDDDLKSIAGSIPKGNVQIFLMSATLTSEIDQIKGLFCEDPVVLDLQQFEKEAEGKDGSEGKMRHFSVTCAEDEKFLTVYVIFKLKLIKGKVIVFVVDVARCYRLKLFLEQFGIKSCVLNSELPVNSRLHVVEEFNKGVYDIIIASDENEFIEQDEEKEKEKGNGDGDGGKKRKRKEHKRDKEYGVSRGVDFQNVACVLNFDMPLSSKSYLHRVGRTARAGKSGMALSFVVPKNLFGKHKSTTIPSAENDEEVLRKISRSLKKQNSEMKPYVFDKKQLDGFRYRMEDALRAVTQKSVREARTNELRRELVQSEKLKRHFEENPLELQHLRHDNSASRGVKVQHHLKHVPEYLLSKLPTNHLAGGSGAFLVPVKESRNRIRKIRNSKKERGKVKKKVDPLKSLRVKK